MQTKTSLHFSHHGWIWRALLQKSISCSEDEQLILGFLRPSWRLPGIKTPWVWDPTPIIGLTSITVSTIRLVSLFLTSLISWPMVGHTFCTLVPLCNLNVVSFSRDCWWACHGIIVEKCCSHKVEDITICASSTILTCRGGWYLGYAQSFWHT